LAQVVSPFPRDSVIEVNCMRCSLLPAKLCGCRLDELLAYNTVRYVSIEDRNLGCLYYFLCFLVFCWVVGFQIVWGNEHYQLWDVKGEARMTIQQPTKNGCNPRKNDCMNDIVPPGSLPYCKEYTGARDKALPHQSECTYADMVDLTPHGMQDPASIFVPTRIDQLVQQQTCTNPHEKCPQLWRTDEHHKNRFVTNIEDYTVMITSNYLRKGNRGHSFQHKGFYYPCEDEHGNTVKTVGCPPSRLKSIPIECINRKNCNRPGQDPPPSNADGLLQLSDDQEFQFQSGLRGTQISRGQDGKGQLQVHHNHEADGLKKKKEAYAIEQGDVFTLRRLLELAGLDLDKTVNGSDPVRISGTALIIHIEYNNMRPWAMLSSKNPDIGFHYRVVHQRLDEMKSESYAARQQLDPKTRVIENRHGILIMAQVTGTFGVFNPVYLLLMLTTSLALLTSAHAVVDALAIYMPSKYQDEYVKAKFRTHVLHDGDEPKATESG